MDRVSATIGLAQAGARVWDVLVIGAGPAGAYASVLLSRAGFSTLLVERKAFPRPKVCGGCLHAGSLALLSEAGLLDAVRATGARTVSSVELRFGERVARLPLPDGLAVSRATFDAVLVRTAIDSGAAFLPETAALLQSDGHRLPSGSPQSRAVLLRQRDDSSVAGHARVVLVCDGLSHPSLEGCPEFSGTVAGHARLGVGGIAAHGSADCEPGTITMAVGRGGYVGMVIIENGGLNLAAALDPAFLKARRSPHAAVREILESARVRVHADLDAVDFGGTPALTRRLLRPVGHRVFVLGDAAGYVEPFTGEGMGWAMSAASAVAPLVRMASTAWTPAIEERWIATYSSVVADRQRWCRALSRVLRYPSFVRPLVSMLGRHPGLARPLLAHLAGAPLAVGGVR